MHSQTLPHIAASRLTGGEKCRLTVGGGCYEIQCLHRRCQRGSGVQQDGRSRGSQAVSRGRAPLDRGTEARGHPRAAARLHYPRGQDGQADLPRLDEEARAPRLGTDGACGVRPQGGRRAVARQGSGHGNGAGSRRLQSAQEGERARELPRTRRPPRHSGEGHRGFPRALQEEGSVRVEVGRAAPGRRP